MSQSFEQYFAQQPEEEKSPEKIKEEKALALAEEIKEIKERMEKEGKTIEGYQRISELVQEIEELYEEKENPELSWDWDTEEKLLTDWEIKYCDDPHFSPDGEKIAASVEDKEGETIAVNGQTWKERFEYCDDPYFSPDGEKIVG